MKKLLYTTAFLALGLLPVQAEVKLPQIISDGMVVQRDNPVRLWGTADPGEQFTVRALAGKKARPLKGATLSVIADSLGRWTATLPALPTGKSYTLEIGGTTVSDLLVGDVLLCSGQSNMELPVSRVTDMFADDIASYTNPSIRQFVVPKEFDFDGPRADTSASRWKSVDDDVLGFSALGYFTARELNAITGLPVGIINASWGGTPVESWISEKALLEATPTAETDFSYYINLRNLYADPSYRETLKAKEGRDYYAWNSTIDAADPGLNGKVRYYSPSLDDSAWRQVDLFSTDWATDGMNPRNGSHWFRKDFTLDASHAGRPATLRMGCIVDADSVWVNGVFVGNTTYQYPPRIYRVPEGVLREGRNIVTVRLISQNGTPHFVAEKPYKLIFGDHPYALYGRTLPDEISLEGTWRYARGAAMPKGPDMMFWCYQPTVLYNAMIAPVINYPVRAALWYQGESNVSRSNQYPALLKTMISDWRHASAHADMPFYIVELAGFLHPDDKAGRAAWQLMRERQKQTVETTPGAVLVPNADLGEWNDIHPLDKKTLGKRAADLISKDF